MGEPVHDLDALLLQRYYIIKNQPVETVSTEVPSGYSTDSTLAKSERSPLEVAYDPSIPNLMLPLLSFNEYQNFLIKGKGWFEGSGVTKGTVADAANLKMQEIITKGLEDWGKALGKIEEARKEDETSPLRLTIDRMQEDISLGKEQSGLVAMSSLIIAASFMGNASSIPGSLGYNSIVNGVQHFNKYIPEDIKAELSLIGAYYAMMAAFQLAVINPAISKTAKATPSQQTEAETARRYGIIILSMVDDPRFHAFLLVRVIGKMRSANEMTVEDKIKLAVIIKLVLLMSSLALVYKKETGGITSNEIAAYLLKGDIMKAGPDDVKTLLASAIKSNLNLLAPGLRDKLLSGVLEYFDSNPEVDDLLDPSKVFEGVLGTSSFTPVDSRPI